jgi:hypothetical protein
MAGYRQTLYGAGVGEKAGKVSISREEAVRVLEEETGRLPLSVVLRCRVRYFTDGMVLGSKEFVEEHLVRAEPEEQQRARRAHPMNGSNWGGLSVGTGLRSNLFR